jgi:hypothetical protein
MGDLSMEHHGLGNRCSEMYLQSWWVADVPCTFASKQEVDSSELNNARDDFPLMLAASCDMSSSSIINHHQATSRDFRWVMPLRHSRR